MVIFQESVGMCKSAVMPFACTLKKVFIYQANSELEILSFESFDAPLG